MKITMMSAYMTLMLMSAVPAHAHGGPDGGLHHALPAVIGFLPLLKVLWNHYFGKAS